MNTIRVSLIVLMASFMLAPAARAIEIVDSQAEATETEAAAEAEAAKTQAGEDKAAQEAQQPGVDDKDDVAHPCLSGVMEDGVCVDPEALQLSPAEMPKPGKTVDKPAQPAEKSAFEQFSDFMDVWITFTFSDDNLRHNDSFTPSIDINNGRHDFENNTDVADTHLVLYKNMDGFLPGVFTEAGLVLRFAYKGGGEYKLKDDGSFVGLRYAFDEAKKNYIEVTGFPLNAERFLLGYSYELTWGGKNSWPQNTEIVPGVRLTGHGQFGGTAFYVFAGLKTHQQTNRDELDSSSGASTGSLKTTYAGLFGGGVRQDIPVLEGTNLSIQLDVNGGFIQKGDNPMINELDLESAGESTTADDIVAQGVSARLALALGDPIGDPLDLRLYRRDPRNLFVNPGGSSYKGSWAVSLSGDFTFMRENLRKFTNVSVDATSDEIMYGSIATTDFDALGLAVHAKARVFTDLRLHVSYFYRNLEFLIFDGPHGDPPFYAFPDNDQLDGATLDISGEHRMRINADYRIAPANLVLGIGFEYLIPARKTLTDTNGNKYVTVYKERETSASSTYLTRQIRAVLPRNYEPSNIMTFKFMARYEFSKMLSAQVEVGYMEDYNMFKYEQMGTDLQKVYEEDDVTKPVSFALQLEAKF